MGAVNKGLDRRAWAAEQRSDPYRAPGDIARIADLEHKLTQVCLDRGEDTRLLRGLTKLVKAGRYDPATGVLTLSLLDIHSDPDVAHVWNLLKRHHDA